MKQSMWRTAASAALLVAAWGHTSAAQDSTPVRGGTLSYAVAGSPHTRDCHGGNSFAVLHYLGPHYSQLLKIDDKTYPNVVGDVAESWTIADDHLTYTFKLRPNVLFHDGTKLTSEDVVATFNRIMDPPKGVISSWRSQYADVKSVEATDPLTVVFKLNAPNSGMLSIFASPWACIYSAARLKEDPLSPQKTIMGTGPYEFVEHVPGSHWVGKRFEKYFKPGLPYLDGFRAVTLSSTALVNALAGGQVDAEFRGISPTNVQRIKQSRGDTMTFEGIEGMGLFMVSLNTKAKPFDDVRVRRALALAIDRWNGIGPLSRFSTLKHVSAFQRPGAVNALPQAELEKTVGFGRDIQAARAEARKLLAEAGVPNLKFQLINRGPDMPYAPFALYLIDQWRQIGVTVDQQVVDTANWAQRRVNGSYEAIVDVTGDWGEDPSFVLVRYLSADVSHNNPTGFIDRKIDELFAAQKNEFDVEKRKALVRQLEAHIINQAFTIPAFRTERLLPLSTRIKGFTLVPAHIYYGDLAEIWLSK